MLVKFLSFVATVFGTARYKAIFLSCLAIVLAITGVTAVAVFKEGNRAPIAASTVDKPESDAQSQGNTPQLNGIRNQAPKSPAQTENQGDAKDKQTTSPNNISPETKAKTSSPEITLSSDKISMNPGSTSDTLTASLSSKNATTWSITPVNSGDNGVKAILDQSNATTLSFQLQTNQDIPIGAAVHLNVIALDADRTTISIKQITVTIQ